MFPILYADNKQGVLKSWEIRVIEGEIPVLECEYGQEGGKKILSHRPVETLKRGHDSLYQMALSMAQSKWIHKKEREGYSEEKIITKKNLRSYSPMLAKTFDGGKHLTFPLYAQPKIDGLRCVAFWDGNSVQLRSRTNVLFSSQCLQPIRKDLLTIFQNDPEIVLDGELYADNVPFEKLSGSIRKEDSHPGFEIYFLCFDIFSDKKNFEERFVRWENPSVRGVRKLETFLVHSLDSVMDCHQEWVKQGYEGTIFRNRKGMYRQGFRSWDLQKHKDFQEKEFPIVGFYEGEGGREKGTVIWECQTEDGKRFRVRPRGDLEYRKELFKNANVFIGQPLTVIFQELTHDGIPRFPVGKEIRKNY